MFIDEKDFKNTYNLFESLIRKKILNQVKELIRKVRSSLDNKNSEIDTLI
jgi:hypothetical protein